MGSLVSCETSKQRDGTHSWRWDFTVEELLVDKSKWVKLREKMVDRELATLLALQHERIVEDFSNEEPVLGYLERCPWVVTPPKVVENMKHMVEHGLMKHLADDTQVKLLALYYMIGHGCESGPKEWVKDVIGLLKTDNEIEVAKRDGARWMETLFYEAPLSKEVATSLVGAILCGGPSLIVRICAVLCRQKHDDAKTILKLALEIGIGTETGALFKDGEYDWVGFDLDHTLIEYDREIMMRTMYSAVIRNLKSSKYLPESFDKDDFPTDLLFLARKGLVLDVKMGYLVQMDATKRIVFGFHGSRMIRREEMEPTHGNEEQRYLTLHTLFEQPLGLVAGAIFSSPECLEVMSAEEWIKKIRNAFLTVQSRYCTYGFENEIETNPAFVPKHEICKRHLIRLRKRLKRKTKWFLLTNSSFNHCDMVMRKGYGKDWESMFDLIITDAKKTKFFFPNNVEPFAFADPSSRKLSKGNAKSLNERFAKHGTRILYVGDHVVQDVVQPRQPHVGWDTVGIVTPTEALFVGSRACNQTYSVRQSLLRGMMETSTSVTTIQSFFEST